MKPRAAFLIVAFATASCLGDPVGPGGTLVVSRVSSSGSQQLVGAPGRALSELIEFQVTDQEGRPIPAAEVQWTAIGTGSRAVDATVTTDEDGRLSATWVLGIRASEAQRLAVQVRTGSTFAADTLDAVAQPVDVADIVGLPDTTTVRLGVLTPLPVEAVDPFGNRFLPADARIVSLDTSLVATDSFSLLARRRGFGVVVAHAGSITDTVIVRAIQVVQSIEVEAATVGFRALGAEATLSLGLRDDQGLVVLDSLPRANISDSSIAQIDVDSGLTVRSLANGNATIVLSAGAVTKNVGVTVAQYPWQVVAFADSLSFDALGDTLHVAAEVRDSLGVAILGSGVEFVVVDSGVAEVSADGMVTTRTNGATIIVVRSPAGPADSVWVNVTQQVAELQLAADTLLLEALDAERPVGVKPLDRLGSLVADAVLRYSVADSTIAVVSDSGVVRAMANGTVLLTAQVGGHATSVVVRVAQRPFRVTLAADTLHFTALGDTLFVAATALDSLNHPVAGGVLDLAVSGSAVTMVGATAVRSSALGLASVTFTVAGLPGAQPVVVEQVPARVDATVVSTEAIVTLPVGATLPLVCAVFDRNGFPTAAVAWVSGETVAAGFCGQQLVERSGYDTLRVTSGPVEVRVPVVVAAAPIVASPVGAFINVDSFPTGAPHAWAPTLRRNSQGLIELYTALFTSTADSTGHTRGDLHRYVWSGGTTFRYAGVAIRHDDDICSPQGQGVENMVVVPRADSVGWRMFYAAGSNVCYGWQVFSAVSTDEVNWVKEPGIRLSNGGNIDPFDFPPWPAGEGMVVDQLPSGEWRMIASTYEHITPSENKWQITEWRSSNQLDWDYHDVLLTTRDLPPEGQSSIFSPTVREIAPGLWRMLFAADNRGQPGARHKIWSAVSTDRVSWQLEGEILGALGSDLFYGSLVDDLVVFIRRDGSGPLRLALATVTMP